MRKTITITESQLIKMVSRAIRESILENEPDEIEDYSDTTTLKITNEFTSKGNIELAAVANEVFRWAEHMTDELDVDGCRDSENNIDYDIDINYQNGILNIKGSIVCWCKKTPATYDYPGDVNYEVTKSTVDDFTVFDGNTDVIELPNKVEILNRVNRSLARPKGKF